MKAKQKVVFSLSFRCRWFSLDRLYFVESGKRIPDAKRYRDNNSLLEFREAIRISQKLMPS